MTESPRVWHRLRFSEKAESCREPFLVVPQTQPFLAAPPGTPSQRFTGLRLVAWLEDLAGGDVGGVFQPFAGHEVVVAKYMNFGVMRSGSRKAALSRSCRRSGQPGCSSA
jgi:hypothetical protein